MKTIGALLVVPFFLSLTFGRQQEVKVVVTSPLGQTSTIDQSRQIFATFNQPMVPLKEVPEDEATGPLEIVPALGGKYRWLGTSTIAFIPANPLPSATEYMVKIPAEIRSVSGQTLKDAVQWKFETPRPRVVTTQPYQGQKFVELDHAILVTFNQKVDPQTASASISIEERNGSSVSFPVYRASRPADPKVRNLEQSVLLTPAKQFQKGSTVTVRIKAGLLGSEGPLGMQGDYVLSFSTYNEFTCNGVVNQPSFEPRLALQIVFSNPVSQREVARHITFDPPIPVDVEAYYDYSETHMYFSLPLKAEQNYTMTILVGLKDIFGNDLTGKRVFTFKTGSFRPSVRMVTGQGILEAYESHKYPVTFTNVDSATLQLARINPDRIVDIMQRLDYSYYQRLAWEQAILEWVTTVGEDPKLFNVSRVWKTSIRRNEPTVRPVDLDEVLGKAKTGVVLLQVQNNFFPQEYQRYLKSLVQVTHMGITAKFSPVDNLIWVTTLKDAVPVGGAHVELRSDSNQVLWKGTTDRDGFVKTPGWGKLGLGASQSEDEEEYYYYGRRQPRIWVIVRHNDDVAFSSSDWNDGIEPYTFNVQYDWNPKFEPIEGSIFSDRGLYKAGEQVDLKSIVRVRRDGTWRIPPKSIGLKLTVRDSRNEELFTEEPRLSAFGTFATGIRLKPDAPLGYYSVTLHTKEMRKGKEHLVRIASASFRVEAFRAAEFEVTARLNKMSYTIGDDIGGTISGRYLFGGAMGNEPVRWRLNASATSWSPPGHEGYWFGRLGWLSRYSYGYKNLGEGEGTLDNQGLISLKGSLPVGELHGPQYLYLEGDVTSRSRQVVSGRTSALVHGGEFYVGIGPAGTFTKKDSVFLYRIIAANPEGLLVPDASISVRVVQRIWRSVRVAETGGRYRWESTQSDSVLEQSTVTTGQAPVERRFVPKEAGFYYIVAAGKDNRGNEIASEAYFYASGSDYVAWERRDDDRIELVASKTDYAPGEMASIIVKSPYEKATALVSLEREGIIRHYTTTLVGSAPQIDIPILKDYLPNVFVSVVLLQGRVEQAAITREADIGRPSFKVGYISLGVSPKEKLLTMNVSTDRKDYRPGDTVEVTIRVKNVMGRGVRAEVALSVADLGVLNLIGYRLPNVFNQFYSPRGLAVTTTETRLHLIEQRSYDEKGEEEGGGGGEEESGMEGVRKDFRPSAYWNPSIVTNAGGVATVRFGLPDNLTSFQLMAVGNTTESDFGYAEESFRVNKPLLLQPSLPRFARVGDAFEGSVVVLNYTEESKVVQLITSVTGISFTGNDTVQYTLKPGEAKEIRNKFLAENVGTAQFLFKAQTNTDRDGLLWNIPIQVPRLRESVALYQSITDQKTLEKVVIPQDIYHDLGEMQVTLASTGMVGLSEGISYLFDYPYGCLEQRLSRLLPMILAEDLVKAFDFKVLEDKDYKAVVTEMVGEIPLFQRDDGGFAYWKNTSDTWPYLSAYTMFTLVKAKQTGYSVGDQTLENGFKYLRKALAREVRWPWASPYYWDCTDALSLYTLAIAGRPDHGYMQRLYTRKDSIPLFAKAYLLKALHATGGYQGLVDELTRQLSNMAKVSQTSAHYEERDDFGNSWCWNSNARTTALILQAMVETQPENNLIPRMVRWLIDQQKVGRWRTTQENLYVVDALATYVRFYEKDEPNFRGEVKIAGGTFMTELFRGRSFATREKSISLSELVLGADYPIDILKSGAGRLYYTIRMNYYPKGESRAKEEGFSVTKKIEAVDNPVEGAKAFAAGTVARVTLTISTNQERNFVVVDDPIPAGFEIINTSFLTSGTNLREEEESPDEWWSYNPFRHREMYNDRAMFFADYLTANVYTVSYLVRATSYGTFAMPSTRIEGMYEPEVFGQTSSTSVTIR